MRKIAVFKFLLVVAVTTTLVGCKKSSSSSNTSSATGWDINAKEGGFQFNTEFEEQETSPGLVFIEGGTFTMGQVRDDVMHDWNNTPNQQHVMSYYMDESEVTNKMYTEYLHWIKHVYPPSDETYRAIYYGVLPDTLVWRDRLGSNEVMTENYLRHPGYADYPVVGVSWIQAVEYANWRSDRVNELYLERAGYLKENARITDVTADSNFNMDTYINAPTETYGGNQEITLPEKGVASKKKAPKSKDGSSAEPTGLYATRETGIISPKYRLPTEAEWEYAALGMSDIRDYNIYRGRKKYPWQGQYTRNGKRKVRGDQLANFKQGKGDYGGIAGWSDDGADITQRVKYYDPNDYGLYDMAGNVAEWVADVYRPIVDSEYTDFNYFRGNVYTKNAITEEGTVHIITSEDVVYDTLSTGKLVARNLPGEILQVSVDENETYLRTNFDKSNEKNFRDGDKMSSRFYDQDFDDEGDDASAPKESEETRKMMYNSPKHNVRIDSSGKVIRQYDKTNTRTSLVNDEVRVYKGGSWKDREYWMDPAMRRFYPQDMATDYIGFRCAMSRVGSKTAGGAIKKKG